MMDPKEEWVLLVPPKLAKSSYATLVDSQCVFRPWHLEGRFGSRTHRHPLPPPTNDDNDTTTTTKKLLYKIGIPVLSKDHVLQQANSHSDLKQLLQEDDVEFVWKAFTPSNRAVRDAPYFDARIHPERAPSTPLPQQQPPHSFTYVDLFAGMGGFAVALDALGGTCVMASEIDEACQRLYRRNFPTAPLLGDIYQIDKLPANTNNTKVDLLVGGFPCQPFSALGEQPGIDCPKAGGLFLEIVRLLKMIQPRAFLLENVPGLLAMKDTFDQIIQALQGAGYSVQYDVCNARGLTASSRKRLFIVGFLVSETNATTNTDSNDNTPQSSFEFPYVPDLQLKASDVIDFTNQELSDMEAELLPISDQQLDQLQHHCKKWRPAHMAWPNTTCNTLVSHYGNSIARGHSQLVPASAATANANNPRRFSPRECIRLMGFPASYQLPSKPPQDSVQGDRAFLKEHYRMAGNAVCPPLIAALAGAVLAHGSAQPQSWVDYGRQVAVDLAYQATRTGRPQANDGKNDNGGDEHNKSAKRPFDALE
ncbi:Modification methylase [Seminavis robusta]|uniref:Cytosine-specific methyltransferase n=1 Tax=Seminavis robusta TaxID=568900 RepID=A0A9N8HW70_9STRA|nr:Modification methylase [Seminavis robusta]|eukprot:Sro2102_g314620.1 Modification methylase (535) ;mRNA; r:8435-10039